MLRKSKNKSRACPGMIHNRQSIDINTCIGLDY